MNPSAVEACPSTCAEYVQAKRAAFRAAFPYGNCRVRRRHAVFDAPSGVLGGTTAGTHTPLSSAGVDERSQFVEIARLAFDQAQTSQDPRKRIAYSFLLATAREPGSDEIGVLLDVTISN